MDIIRKFDRSINFFSVPRELSNAELTPATKAVYMVLANAKNRTTGQLNPSAREIARQSNLSKRKVDYALADLTDAGWIYCLDEPKRGRSMNRELATRDDGRFICLPKELASSELSSNAKVVYMALVSFRNNATNKLNPSYAAIAERCGSNISSVKRALRELTKAGWIRNKRSFNGSTSRDLFVVGTEATVTVQTPKADPRANHPAITAVQDITRRFPEKKHWDQIISTLGEYPDRELLSELFHEWHTVRGYNPRNLPWVFEWYARGSVPGKKKSSTQAIRELGQMNHNQSLTQLIAQRFDF